MPAPSSVHVGPDSSAPVATSKGHSIERAQPVISMPPSARASMERSEPARVVNSSCPLEVGHDPRRESIGGDSAPPHLRGIPPLRVLPEVGSPSLSRGLTWFAEGKLQSGHLSALVL